MIAALMTLCALSWAYLWAVPMPMTGMDTRVSPGFVLLRFLMWFIMMLAMMTPANLPAALLFHRDRLPQAQRVAAVVSGGNADPALLAEILQ